MSQDEKHGMHGCVTNEAIKNQLLPKTSSCLHVYSKIGSKDVEHNIPCVPTGSLIRPRRPRLVYISTGCNHHPH